ncbi:MAG: prepilin peptidase [Clostridiales bacterium]|nr:prepilin peptidase [Clostridiales bacterium]
MLNNSIYYMIIFLCGICIGVLLNTGICRILQEKMKTICYLSVMVLNGILYVLVISIYQWTYLSVIYCLSASALIVLSVVDYKIYEIPSNLNLLLGFLGVVRLVMDISNIWTYLLGFGSVSFLLLLIYYFTKGKGIGGGDIKLMAAAGLLIGFPKIVLAFILGCILGSILHILRMKIRNEGSILAFGPYLSAGIVIAMLYGEQLIRWYLNLLQS